MTDTGESEVPKPDEQPLTVVFVRHADAEQHDPPDYPDPPLTARGRCQVELIAKRLSDEKFNHIYSSDLTRARETAERIRRFHGETAFTETRDVREVSNHHFLPGKDFESDAVREMVMR